jgi:hypothetical protein
LCAAKVTNFTPFNFEDYAGGKKTEASGRSDSGGNEPDFSADGPYDG